MLPATGEVVHPGGIRTFSMIVNVSVHLAGTFEDWPSQIQDGIYAALEKKAHELQLPLVIVYSNAGVDIDNNDMPFVHVIASEVVVADEHVMARSHKIIHPGSGTIQ